MGARQEGPVAPTRCQLLLAPAVAMGVEPILSSSWLAGISILSPEAAALVEKTLLWWTQNQLRHDLQELSCRNRLQSLGLGMGEQHCPSKCSSLFFSVPL